MYVCEFKNYELKLQNFFDQTILWNVQFLCVACQSQYLLGAFKKQVEKDSAHR